MNEAQTGHANTYTCEQCGGTFGKKWSDEEALAEKTANGFDGFDCAIVCDNCYKMIMGEILQ